MGEEAWEGACWGRDGAADVPQLRWQAVFGSFKPWRCLPPTSSGQLISLMQPGGCTTPEPRAPQFDVTAGSSHRQPLAPDTAPGVAASKARESGRRCKGLGGAAHDAASRSVADRAAGERRGGAVRARVLLPAPGRTLRPCQVARAHLHASVMLRTRHGPPGWAGPARQSGRRSSLHGGQALPPLHSLGTSGLLLCPCTRPSAAFYC